MDIVYSIEITGNLETEYGAVRQATLLLDVRFSVCIFISTATGGHWGKFTS